jgi:quercetin dioxygenase-like cupin family protein
MEIKRNEATINRPDGDRVLDGNYVFVDIPSYVRQIKEEKAWEKNDRNGITVFKSTNITMVITILHKDSEICDNELDGFLSIQVLDGNVRITTPDGDIDVIKNQVITFHPHIKHSIEATAESIILLTTFNKEDEPFEKKRTSDIINK